LLGCQNNYSSRYLEPAVNQSIVYQAPVSYKLEDLCDTEIYDKNITVNVYIEPSEILWDYHKYKDEIFKHTRDFFKENQINCNVVYSDVKLKKFIEPNEFGIEILDSKIKKDIRYVELMTGFDFDEKLLGGIKNSYNNSLAATRAQTALILGRHMSYSNLTEGEVKEIYQDFYKHENIKESVLRELAAHFSHELLHCMGLFHPENFSPSPIEELDVPNIMTNKIDRKPKIGEDCVVGYKLDELQKKLIHSFVAGNNSYKAFADSQKDLLIYSGNLADKNNFKIVYFK